MLLLLPESGVLNRSCLVDQAGLTNFSAEYLLEISDARRLVLNASGHRPHLEWGTTERAAFLSPCLLLFTSIT